MSRPSEDRNPTGNKVLLSVALAATIIGGCVLLWILLAPKGPPRVGEKDAGLDGAETAAALVPDAKTGEEPKAVAEETPAEEAVPTEEAGPAALSGRVTGEGAPVEGATVLIFSARDVEGTLRRIERLIPSGEMPDVQAIVNVVRGELENLRTSARKATTDADGRYAYATLEAGGYVALTVAEEWLFRYGDVAGIEEGVPATLDMDLSRGGEIRGRVLSTRGGSIPGATVLAEFRPPGTTGVGAILRKLLKYVNGEFLKGPFETTSADDGSFRLAGLPPGAYDLAAGLPDGPEARTQGIDTGSQDVVVLLGAPARVEGRFADAAGAPAPGVVAILERQEDQVQLPIAFSGFNRVANSVARLVGDGPRKIEADSAGSFRSDPLGPGKYKLAVELPGFLVLERAFELEWDQTLDLGVLQLDRGGSISGVVLAESGDPIEGAKVLFTPADVNFMNMGNLVGDFVGGRAMAATGPDGRFRKDGLMRGKYRVTTTAVGYAPAAVKSVATGEASLEIKLRPGVTVEGTVTDAASAKPVVDAIVRVGDIRTRTDAEGHYTLLGVSARDPSLNPFGGGPMGQAAEARSTTVQVSASAPGYLEGKGQLDLEASPLALDIQIDRAPSIVGKVFDPEKKPLPACLVRLIPHVSDQFMPGVSDFFDKGLIFLAVGTTKLDGSFRLSGFSGANLGQSYRVIADHPLHARGSSEPFVLEGKSAAKEGEEIGVAFVPGDAPPGTQPESTGTPGAEVEITMRLASRIRGVVTDGRGPVASAAVRLSKVRAAEGPASQAAAFMSMLGLPKSGEVVYTSKDGRYVYDHMNPGNYSLEAEMPGFMDSPAIEVSLGTGEEKEVDLVLDPGGAISGVVIDAAGAAVNDARVRLLREPEGPDEQGRRMLEAQKFFGGATKSGRSLDDGSFSIGGLSPGTYTAMVTKSGYAPKEVSGLVPQGGETKVVLERAATLRGVVVDMATDRPVTVFRVAMKRSGEGTPGIPDFLQARECVDAEGRFVRDDIEPGLYTVEVSAGGYTTTRTEVDFASGAEISQRFPLPQAGRIRGRVTDAATGIAIAGARVGLSRRRGAPEESSEPEKTSASERRAARKARSETERAERQGEETPDARNDDAMAMGEFVQDEWLQDATVSAEDGTFLLEGVPGGTQDLVVRHGDYVGNVHQALEVGMGQEIEVNPALERGLRLAGTVRDAEGKAVPGRWVFVRGTGPENARTRKGVASGQEGEFALAGLPRGPYRLIVASQGGNPNESTVVEVDLRESQEALAVTVPGP